MLYVYWFVEAIFILILYLFAVSYWNNILIINHRWIPLCRLYIHVYVFMVCLFLFGNFDFVLMYCDYGRHSNWICNFKNSPKVTNKDSKFPGENFRVYYSLSTRKSLITVAELDADLNSLKLSHSNFAGEIRPASSRRFCVIYEYFTRQKWNVWNVNCVRFEVFFFLNNIYIFIYFFFFGKTSLGVEIDCVFVCRAFLATCWGVRWAPGV